MLGLTIVKLEVKTGWIRERVKFTIEGPESTVRRFIRRMDADMEEYNE